MSLKNDVVIFKPPKPESDSDSDELESDEEEEDEEDSLLLDSDLREDFLVDLETATTLNTQN